MIDTDKKPSSAENLEDFERALADVVTGYIRISDKEEESRRVFDRIGANMYYGRHYNKPVPASRAAITANVTKALIDHKIAIMTKQDPIPIVEPADSGDNESSELMRSAIMQWWTATDSRLKSRDVLRLANCTRTTAGKVVWDEMRHGGVGDVDWDVIPGFRLILDPRTRHPDRMQFIGDRAYMTRSQAMERYPRAVEKLLDNEATAGNTVLSASSAEAPFKSPFAKANTIDSPVRGAMINGKPQVTSYTSTSIRDNPSVDVEIVELYHRDHTLIRKQVVQRDKAGNPVQQLARDESGAPQFNEKEFTMESLDGYTFSMPNFELVFEDVTKEELAPKYPHWRRTTMLFPEGVMLEDIAWDGPQPYALYNDNEPLDGVWAKGSALDVEDLQSQLNLSLSLMMDNLRFSTYRAFVVDAMANIDRNQLTVSPGDVIKVNGGPDKIRPLEFPQLSATWFEWCNNTISLMEKIIGTTGVMQGEAAGRVDSASGYDTLAEISGSRLVESTQRFEHFLSKLVTIAAWFMQRFYTEAHAIKVEDSEGSLSWERAGGTQLVGTFNLKIATGSTLAWSESAVRARLLTELSAGIIDRVEYWKRTNTPHWQQIKQRLLTQNPILSGPAGSPPPRTRSTVHTQQPNGRAGS